MPEKPTENDETKNESEEEYEEFEEGEEESEEVDEEQVEATGDNINSHKENINEQVLPKEEEKVTISQEEIPEELPEEEKPVILQEIINVEIAVNEEAPLIQNVEVIPEEINQKDDEIEFEEDKENNIDVDTNNSILKVDDVEENLEIAENEKENDQEFEFDEVLSNHETSNNEVHEKQDKDVEIQQPIKLKNQNRKNLKKPQSMVINRVSNEDIKQNKNDKYTISVKSENEINEYSYNKYLEKCKSIFIEK